MKYSKIFKLILIGLFGIMGAGIVILLTSPHGAGITPDTVSYVSAARSLADGHGFLQYNGEYLVFQPPLYPIILALIKITFSTDPLISAGYLNGLFFGLIVFISGLFFLKHMKSFVFVILGSA